MEVIPMTGALGAEITDIDLTSLTEAELLAVDQAFHDHLVLIFRRQSLDPASLMTLTQRFGGPGITPYLTGLPDFPDVVPIIKEADEKSPKSFGSGWHTDFTFQSEPPSRTLLYAQETPPQGGDTLFANLYLAYEQLSQGLQSFLRPLSAVHSATRSYGPKSTLQNDLENMHIGKDNAEPPEQIHPVIRAHEITQRASLWIKPTYTLRFEGMTQAESEPLLKYLNEWAVQPTFMTRVQWQPGTLVMWDNRCTQHCATSDYHGHRRSMLRTTVQGPVPQKTSPSSIS